MARKTKAPAAEAPPAIETAAPTQDRSAREEAATLAAVREARELRAQLLLDSGEDEQIDALDAEIKQHETKLARLAEARAMHEVRNTKAAKAARRKQARDDFQQALDDARKLGEMAKDTLVSVVELGARLAVLEETKAAIFARFIGAAEDISENISESDVRQLRGALSALTLPDSFLRRLWSVGLGRTGVKLSADHLHIRPVSGQYIERDPDEVVTAAVSKLKQLASNALNAQKEAA